MKKRDEMFPGETVEQYKDRMKADNPNLIHPYDVELFIREALDGIHTKMVEVEMGERSPLRAAEDVVDDLISDLEWLTRENEKWGDAERVEKIAGKVDELRNVISDALLAVSEALKGVD